MAKGKYCVSCGRFRPSQAFNPQRTEYNSYGGWCTDCSIHHSRERNKRATLIKEYNLEKHVEKTKVIDEQELARKIALRKQKAKEKRQAIKKVVFDHYGRQCVYCGTTEDLEIDHMNGDGREHRKEITDLYVWLIKNNFPDRFQVLCSKHNFVKGSMTDEQFRQFIDETYKYLHGRGD